MGLVPDSFVEREVVFMKNEKWKKLLIIIGILSILLSGCASAKKAEENSAGTTQEIAFESEAGFDTGAIVEDKAEDFSTEEKNASVTDGQNTEVKKENRKLIKNVYMNIETREFDSFMETMSQQIENLGGYIESSNIQGNSYDYEGTRYSNVIARIPADQLDDFLGKISEIGNVISKDENVQDITFQYTDIESHKKALQVEQERLLELLAKAEGIEAIIAIETRLSEIRYQLENYESQIRIYDNQIEYSTVTMQITEVERITSVSEQSIVGKIKTGFLDSLYHIGSGFKNFFIWFLIKIPYLILVGIVISIAVLGYKKVLKNDGIRRNKKVKQESEEENKIKQK